MKYKNIVFDFGNVLAKFDADYIIGMFCQDENDAAVIKEKLFFDWDKLDAGYYEYDKYMDHVADMLPKYLIPVFREISTQWYMHLDPIKDIWKLIHDLKETGKYKLYILSNASTIFSDHASYYSITKEFDGIVFSAPLKMAKPEPDIYKYLFKTYDLDPEECFFIDDRKDNIEAGNALGMDGLVFTPDKIDELRKLLLQ